MPNAKPNSGLDVIPDPVVRFDRELTYEWANQAACRLIGCSREELIGRRHIEVSGDPEVDRVLRAALDEAFETGAPGCAEVRYARDGNVVYEVRIAPELDDDGRARTVLVIGRDITHHKQLEQALAERVKELRCLYNVSAVLAAGAGDTRSAVCAVCNTIPSGWQFPELARARIVLGAHEVRSPGFQKTAQTLSAPIAPRGVRIGIVELSYVEPREFLPEERELIAAIADRLGEAALRWEADRRLAASHAYLQALFEASADVIAVTGADASVSFVSPSCEALLGIGPDALIGASIRDFVHPDDRAAVDRELERSLADPSYVGRAQYRIRHANGTYRTVETTGRNRLSDPAVRGIVVSTRDLTERRELELQLLQAQKMELVGRLAGGIAHDFNNVLSIIEASAELLSEELPVDHSGQQDVHEIREASRRAAGLTRRLLALSRRQVMQPQLLDLGVIARDMGKLLHRLIGEDVELVTRIETNGDLVRADPAQLEQVLLNLAVNAREAMPRGGRLSIAVGTCVGTDGARKCFLEVEDTGVGIEEPVLERIFDPFFTTKPHGTGLGLSTVYGIVKQSGGTVTVRSTWGEGACFRVELPIAGSGEISILPSPRHVVHEARGVERVLVVEDDEALRSLARRILERRGYHVRTASNGAEALSLLSDPAERIDLLLADVVMPGMSGRELAELAQARRPSLRILYTSGYTDDAILRHGVRTAAMRLLPKPFSPDALALAVRDALDAA